MKEFTWTEQDHLLEQIDVVSLHLDGDAEPLLAFQAIDYSHNRRHQQEPLSFKTLRMELRSRHAADLEVVGNVVLTHVTFATDRIALPSGGRCVIEIVLAERVTARFGLMAFEVAAAE